MHSQIITAMNSLVKTQTEAMPYPVLALSKRRWMIEADPGPVVQFELMDDGTALIYATVARDGSGPLRASFMTMLLLEDSVANSMSPHGVCSGEATVTIYQRVRLADATPAGLFRQMMAFSQLAAAHFARRGVGLPGFMPVDDREVA